MVHFKSQTKFSGKYCFPSRLVGMLYILDNQILSQIYIFNNIPGVFRSRDTFK